jgi:RimJ/RimL family protein N-acetyltransferase
MMVIPTPLPNLKGLCVTLRRPVPGDVAARLAIGRHAEIVRAYGRSFDPAEVFTREHAERSIAFLIDQPYAWVIDVEGFIGHVRFHNVDGHDQRAAIAIGIEDPARVGRGLGTEALRLALGFGFAAGLHRESVRVLASNARAIACYRKCGFIEEGREREAALVEGGWQDDLIMGLLDHEFAALSAQDRNDTRRAK